MTSRKSAKNVVSKIFVNECFVLKDSLKNLQTMNLLKYLNFPYFLNGLEAGI